MECARYVHYKYSQPASQPLRLFNTINLASTAMVPFSVLTATVTDIEELLSNGTLTSEAVVTEY